MAKFIFNLVYRDKDGEFINDENIWVRADNKLDALSKVREEYPHSTDFVLLKSE